MNNYKTSYPGIVNIKAVKCSDIPPNILKKYLAEIPIQILCDYTPIATIGDITCETSQEMSLNSQIESLKLQFFTLEDDRMFNSFTAFIIQTNSGETYIVGTREAPYPQILKAFNTGVPGKDSSVNTITVTLKNLKTLIPIII